MQLYWRDTVPACFVAQQNDEVIEILITQKLDYLNWQKIIRALIVVSFSIVLIFSSFVNAKALTSTIKNQTIKSDKAFFVSNEYSRLENQLNLFGIMSENSQSMLVNQKRAIVEQQISILNLEINQLANKIAICKQKSVNAEAKVESLQMKAAEAQAESAQKIKSVSEDVANSYLKSADAVDVVAPILNQIAEIQQVAEADKQTTLQINQIDAARRSAQCELDMLQMQLMQVQEVLQSKREDMYNLLYTQKGKLLSGAVKQLADISNTTTTTINVDSDSIVWSNPCIYTKITSPFGYRIDPFSGNWSMHNGVDFIGEVKTVICATRSGVVVDAGYDSNSGYHVVIDHLDGYKSYYLHLLYYPGLKVGDVITIGDSVGLMGSSGASTGMHLHFGIRHNNQWVDPMNYIS